MAEFEDLEGLQLLSIDIEQDPFWSLSLKQQSSNSVQRQLRFKKMELNPWLDYVDIVGNLKSWPTFIRQAFWSGPNFNDHLRMIVVNFSILNGVHISVLLKTLEFTIGKHLYRCNRRYQVIARYKYLTEGNTIDVKNNRSRCWSYHVISREIRTLNHERCDSKGNILPPR